MDLDAYILTRLIPAANDSSKINVVRTTLQINVNGVIKHLNVSLDEKLYFILCLQIICHYLKHKPLPQFPYMTRFHASFCNSDLEKLPNFLESSPNLKSLVLVMNLA